MVRPWIVAAHASGAAVSVRVHIIANGVAAAGTKGIALLPSAATSTTAAAAAKGVALLPTSAAGRRVVGAGARVVEGAVKVVAARAGASACTLQIAAALTAWHRVITWSEEGTKDTGQTLVACEQAQRAWWVMHGRAVCSPDVRSLRGKSLTDTGPDESRRSCLLPLMRLLRGLSRSLRSPRWSSWYDLYVSFVSLSSRSLWSWWWSSLESPP